MKKKWFGDAVYAASFWFVVSIIAFLILDFLVLPFFAGRWRTQTEVPEVRSMVAAEAEAKITEAGLSYHWLEEGRFSATVPAGAVLTQLPKPGRQVKEGRTIVLTVSKGRREVEIPDLRGKSMRQSEIALAQLGLVRDQIIKRKHSSIPMGVVIRSEPGPEDNVKIGSKVNLIVSAGGQGGIYLPDFLGKSKNSVETAMDTLNFPIQITPVDSADATLLPNTVVYQYPRGGEYLPESTTVIIKVSKE